MYEQRIITNAMVWKIGAFYWDSTCHAADDVGPIPMYSLKTGGGNDTLNC